MPKTTVDTPYLTYADQQLDRLRDLVDQIVADSHAEGASEADAETVARWALDLAANFDGLDRHLTHARRPHLPGAWARARAGRWRRLAHLMGKHGD